MRASLTVMTRQRPRYKEMVRERCLHHTQARISYSSSKQVLFGLSCSVDEVQVYTVPPCDAFRIRRFVSGSIDIGIWPTRKSCSSKLSQTHGDSCTVSLPGWNIYVPNPQQHCCLPQIANQMADAGGGHLLSTGGRPCPCSHEGYSQAVQLD